MPRRTYRKAEVYVDEQFLAADAKLTYDSTRHRIEVKAASLPAPRVIEGTTFVSTEQRGRDRVRTFTADGVEVVSITQGCICGR